jgi:acyl-coenzyme A thioesterase PaaI-like protein
MTNPEHRPNRLERQLERLLEVPAFLRPWVRSLVLGRAVPFTETAKLRYEEMSPGKVQIVVADRHRVRNHIGGVHAMASTLAAETATGMVMGMNVRDDCIPVVKDMRVQFKKRGQGAMRAVATLSHEQRALISSTTKGEVTVAVTVTDESGNQPIECEFIWAWIPSERQPKTATAS